jgi:signal transduction histidine kinase
MSNNRFNFSLRARLFFAITLVFLLVSFVIQLTLWLMMQSSETYTNQPIKDWQRTHLADKYQQSSSTQSALSQFCHQTSPIDVMYWQQLYAQITIDELLVADVSGAPVWSCQQPLASINLWLSLPLQSRDDLADVLTGKPNSGVELLADGSYLVIKAIDNEHGDVIGVLVSKQQWHKIDAFSHWFYQPSKALMRAVQFSLSSLFWGLPSALLIAFFMARLLSARLSAISRVISFWSKGNLTPRLDVVGTNQIADSLQQLNQLAQDVETLLSEQKHQVQLAERQRIAAELHDTVKQLLFANNLQLAGCQQALSKSIEQAQPFLKTAQVNNHQAFEQINQLIDALKPEAFIGEGFFPAIGQMLGDWTNKSGIVVENHISQIDALNAQTCHLLHRCIQEGLQNISKHSNATKVTITLLKQTNTLELTINDNGKNAQLQPFGQGLLLMQTRLQTLNGTLDINTQNGYQLLIRIPL